MVFEAKREVRWAAKGKVWDEVARFEEDVVFGVSEASKGGEKSGDGV